MVKQFVLPLVFISVFIMLGFVTHFKSTFIKTKKSTKQGKALFFNVTEIKATDINMLKIEALL
jgi:hypothetical protein